MALLPLRKLRRSSSASWLPSFSWVEPLGNLGKAFCINLFCGLDFWSRSEARSTVSRRTKTKNICKKFLFTNFVTTLVPFCMLLASMGSQTWFLSCLKQAQTQLLRMLMAIAHFKLLWCTLMLTASDCCCLTCQLPISKSATRMATVWPVLQQILGKVPRLHLCWWPQSHLDLFWMILPQLDSFEICSISFFETCSSLHKQREYFFVSGGCATHLELRGGCTQICGGTKLCWIPDNLEKIHPVSPVSRSAGPVQLDPVSTVRFGLLLIKFKPNSILV